MFHNLLFDLDGTLVDPRESIVNAIQFALEKLGREAPDSQDLEWCIGLPLLHIFAKLLDTTDKILIQQAIGFYRQRFTEQESKVYNGITEALIELCRRGVKLYVATSKPISFAIVGLQYFELDSYFEGIFGSDLSGERSDKTELLAFLLAEEGLNPEYTLMIGDREHDMIGARQNQVHAAGALYGYGTEEELQAAGAEMIFRSPGDILEYCN